MHQSLIIRSIRFGALAALAFSILANGANSVFAQGGGKFGSSKPNFVTRVYYVLDLAVAPEFDLTNHSNNQPLKTKNPFGGGFGGGGGGFGGGGGAFSVPSSRTQGGISMQGGGIQGGGSLGGGMRIPQTNNTVNASTGISPDVQSLIHLIQSCVEPKVWETDGGASTITEFHSSLVIRASEDTHKKVKTLLSELRALKGKKRTLQIHWVAVLANKTERDSLLNAKGTKLENALDQHSVNSGMFSVVNGRKEVSSVGEYRNFMTSVTPVVGGSSSGIQIVSGESQQGRAPVAVSGNQVGYRPEITSVLFGWQSTVIAVTDEVGKTANVNFQISYTDKASSTSKVFNQGFHIEKADRKQLKVTGQTKSASGTWNCIGSIDPGNFFDKTGDLKGDQKKKLMIFLKWE